MVELQRKAYVMFTLLSILATGFTVWATQENGTIFSVVPIVSLLLFILLLVAFCRAKESWFERDTLKWEELRAAVLVLLAINLASSALLLFTAEARHIDNTLDGVGMLRLSLLAGAPVGVMFWVKLAKIFEKKNIVMLKVFLISFALFSATGTSQLNRKHNEAGFTHTAADVISKEKGIAGPVSFLTRQQPANYIFIPHHDDVERLVVPEPVWNVAFQSASLNLSIKTGYFGYPYVARFNNRALE